MSDPTILSYAQHGHLRLSELKDYTKFRTQHLVPVVFQEFYGLATEFPLVFVRSSESGDFIPVALMGLIKGKNLYCQTPKWTPTFVPSSFTLTPFAVNRLEPDSDEAVITVEEDSSLLNETDGEPLFNGDGERTPYLQKRIDRLVNITRQSLQALALCRLLADMRLLKARPLTLQYSSTAPRYEVEGVYIIDEDALEKLTDEEFLKLRKRGVLPLIYSHLTSLQQIGRLSRLQNEFDRQQTEQPG